VQAEIVEAAEDLFGSAREIRQASPALAEFRWYDHCRLPLLATDKAAITVPLRAQKRIMVHFRTQSGGAAPEQGLALASAAAPA
jgi:hypothetical protein